MLNVGVTGRGKGSTISKYERLAELLREQIRKGVWKQSEQLPTDQELIEKYNVSQTTVTSAMRVLSDEGLIVRRRGAGTTLADPNSPRAASKTWRIFLLCPGAHDEMLNPAAWFGSASVLRGLVNENHHYIIRAPIFDEVDEALRATTNPVAYIFMNVKPEKIPDRIAAAPSITLHGDSRDAESHNAVNFDKITSSYRGIEYLIRTLGHRDIAMIWGELDAHREYLEAYRLALSRNRLPFCESLVVNSKGGTEREGYAAMSELLKRSEPPAFTAVYVDTDLKALGAIRRLREQGLRVPEDVSVLGTDDVPAVSDDAGLTTVQVPYYDMGRHAMELLHRRIRSKGRNMPSVMITGDIMERRSTRPLKG